MKKIKINNRKRGIYRLKPRVLKFKGEVTLTESDMESLFMGVFRLVKSVISESEKIKYISKINMLENELKKYRKNDTSNLYS